MKKRIAKEYIPCERQITIRQEIISLLEKEQIPAKKISNLLHISEKDVLYHLDYIKKTVLRRGKNIKMTPSECKKCGFIFEKREKFKKPSKCPKCKGESIEEPFFYIE